MGGLETEIDDHTTNVLIEAANFNFINIRKTTQQMKLPSEAASRFGRGIHPAMAPRGNIRSANLIQQLAGGTIDTGVVDNYANPVETVTVTLPIAEVKRILGFDIEVEKIAQILESLEFKSEVNNQQIRNRRYRARSSHRHHRPARSHRRDRAHLRTGSHSAHGAARRNAAAARQSRAWSLKSACAICWWKSGLFEAVTYAMTTPQAEAKLAARRTARRSAVCAGGESHQRGANAPAAHAAGGSARCRAGNAHHHDRVALFSIDKVYLASEDGPLPDEPRRLTIVMTGAREPESWQRGRSDGRWISTISRA